MSRASSIQSLQNPQVKNLVRLRARREREAQGVILIEGARELTRAAQAGVKVQEVYTCPELFNDEARHVTDQAVLSGARFTGLSRAAFEKVSGRENPDGLLAVALPPQVSLDEPGTDAVVVVLHGLEKPGNVGAIIRTADAAGAHGIMILGRGADPYGPNVIRASQGSVFKMPVLPLNEDEALSWLAGRDFQLVACTPDAPQDYWHAPLTGRVALLLGTEHAGLPDRWRSGRAVRIPMQPGSSADSLNVATAAALVLYECARQREAQAAGTSAGLPSSHANLEVNA